MNKNKNMNKNNQNKICRQFDSFLHTNKIEFDLCCLITYTKDHFQQ